MKKKNIKDDLRFSVSREAFPEPRELSMDDYCEFVVSNLLLFGKPRLEEASNFKPFVIREGDTAWPEKKLKKK